MNMNRSRQPNVARPQASVRTVLIVDDEPLVRESLRRYLKHVGYIVIEAVDFDAAISALQGMWFDAMVLDVRLPGRSGLELLEHLRAEAKLAALPVMVLTGYFPDAAEQALLNKLGASIFYKPRGCFTVVRHLERMIRAQA
jgi:DNA-binding response OmpR family regulator